MDWLDNLAQTGHDNPMGREAKAVHIAICEDEALFAKELTTASRDFFAGLLPFDETGQAVPKGTDMQNCVNFE